MTGPLSGAFKGYSYKGAFGNDAQAVANMGAGLAKGRAAEEERRRQAALEAALQRMKEEELGLSRRRVDQGDKELQLAESGQALDRLKVDQTGADIAAEQVRWAQEHNLDRDRLALDTTEGAAERASRERVARIGAESREAVAGMRQVGSGRDYVTLQDSAGKYWRLNKLTNKLDPIEVPTAADFGQEEGAAPAGGQQLTGAGARPSQGELGAKAAYDNLQAQFDMLQDNMAAVAFQAPGVGTQFLMDGAKSTGLGPISSLTRSVSNTVLGNQSPEYQKIQHAVDALGTTVVKMVTGAQMSEAEAVRILNILKTVAGDTPDQVQQKLATVQNIINNEKVKVGRADSEQWRTGVTPAQGFNGQTQPSQDRGAALKAKYGLE